MTENNIRILYITGEGRSGSTLLEQMLAQTETFVATGELRHLWERGIIEDQLCGCTHRFSECSFWNQVMIEAFGGKNGINPKKIISIRRKYEIFQFIPSCILEFLHLYDIDSIQYYLNSVTKLFRAIQKLNENKIIIDSSKNAWQIMLYSLIPNTEVFVLHLVRDSRAVAFSWEKRKQRIEIPGKVEYMRIYKPYQTAWRWLLKRNLFTELLTKRKYNYLRIRYEDLINNPGQLLKSIFLFTKTKIPKLSFIEKGFLNINKISHTVSGNSIRFQRGKVRLQMDNSWKKEMSKIDKFLVTVITWPFLLRYGYFSKH